MTATKMTETAKKNLRIHTAAHVAGTKAAEQANPTPMVVSGRDPVTNVNKNYYVAQGPCGFAWVRVVSGNSSFARWAKKERIARSAHTGGGVQIFVTAGGQSMQIKQAYAAAYAGVLHSNGVAAQVESRMD